MKGLMFFVLLANVTGCASSSDLADNARFHATSGSYYESIGQFEVAEDEYRRANESYENAAGFFPILFEVISRIGSAD